MEHQQLLTKLENLVRNLPKHTYLFSKEELAQFKHTPYEAIISTLVELHEQLTSNKHNTESISPEYLNKVLEASERGLWIWNLKNDTFQLNDYLCKMFNVNQNTLEQTKQWFLNLIIPEDRAKVQQALMALANYAKQHSDTNATKSIEFTIRWPDETMHKIVTKATIASASTTANPQIIGVCWSATKAKKIEQKIKTTLNEFKTLAELAPVGIFQAKINGEFLYANNYWYELLKTNQDDMLGKRWLDFVADEDRSIIQKKWDIATKNGSRFKEEFRIKSTDGEILWIACDATPLNTSANAMPNYLSVSVNITEQQHMEANLNYLAYYDGLTGLSNRSLFQEKLKEALLRNARSGKYVVLLFLDLDGFKLINDTLGHDAGDLLLKQVALRLEQAVRRTDIIARLGGDEFTILFENVDDPHRISVSAKKVNDVLAEKFIILDQEVHVTASIGLAVSSKDVTDHQTLIKQADIAMYLAKEKGKNNFQYFTDELNTEIHHKMTLGSKMYRALELQELKAFYQPQVNMKTNKVYGVEVLLRWFNKELGNIPPAEFIPIAEDNGLIIPISEWLIRDVCKQLMQWNKQSKYLNNLHASINLSPRHFNDGSLLSFIREVIAETKIKPENLVFEITEGILIGNREDTKNVLKLIKELGATIALDDFGTGYSSLSYLKQFPIDILKIDQSFVKHLLIDPEDASIVSAIIALSKSLNIEVVAEGVETKAMADYLIEHGCELGQGYYYAKPMPAAELINWTLT